MDLIGEKATPNDITKTEAMLEMNYGTEYPREKFSMLWEMVREENWTAKRLVETVKWFLKNTRFPNWTIADWFDYEIPLYSHHQYLIKLNESKSINDQITWIKINGQSLWGYTHEIKQYKELLEA